jgi:hypothetical protein
MTYIHPDLEKEVKLLDLTYMYTSFYQLHA